MISHSLVLYKPTTSEMREHDTPMSVLNYPLGLIGLFMTVFSWIPPAYVIPGIIGMILLGLMVINTLLVFTHKEKALDNPERKLWNKYNNLESDTRAEIGLTIDDLKEIGKRHDEFWELDKQVEGLARQQRERIRIEQKMNPLNSSFVDSVRSATEREVSYIAHYKKELR